MNQIEKDRISRREDIEWPEPFSPESSGLFAHNEILIAAPVERVWKKLIEGPKWPTWFILTKVFEIEGGLSELQMGSHFRWGTASFQVEGNVVEFQPSSRLSFTGAVKGHEPAFLHVWRLYEEGNACLAVYEEVGVGERATELGRNDGGALHRSHDLMLASLKWISESSHPL